MSVGAGTAAACSRANLRTCNGYGRLTSLHVAQSSLRSLTCAARRCTGQGALCPVDGKMPNTFQCRPAKDL